MLKSVLDYEPVTGLFRWKTERSNHPTGGRIGTIAGSLASNGYWRIWLFGREHLAHRLAWLWMTGGWPPIDIDHENLVRNDNSWENLRLASEGENAANATHKKTKGWPFVKGVTFKRHLRKNPFRASIEKDGVNYHLGYHPTIEDAQEAYNSKAVELFGSYARAA